MEKQLWEYEIAEIAAGYAREGAGFCCLLCGGKYEAGRVYEMGGLLYDAEGAVKHHVAEAHGTAADWLLEQEPALMGLTEVQRQILQHVSAGRPDAEIAKREGVAPSTVRNHRFKLREKEKQAALYLALLRSLAEKTEKGIGMTEEGELEAVHAAATMVDDRYGITAAEREKTLKAYFDENGALRQIPAREKKKIIVLREIMKNFKPEEAYSEKEVNRVLGRIHSDHATLRRALIEYGFMDRTPDGSVYRATGN